MFEKGPELSANDYALRYELALDHLEFAGKLGLVSLLPTLLLCMVIGQLWPLVLVAGSDMVGLTIGVFNFVTPVEHSQTLFTTTNVRDIGKEVTFKHLPTTA